MKYIISITLIVIALAACKPEPTPIPTLPPVEVDRWYWIGNAVDFCDSAKDSLVSQGTEYYFDLGEGEGLHLAVDELKIVYVEDHPHFFSRTRGRNMTGEKLPHNGGWIFSERSPDDTLLHAALVGNCDGKIVTISLPVTP